MASIQVHSGIALYSVFLWEIQISCASLTPDKNILLLGMSNGDVFLWDVQQKARIKDYSLYPYIQDSSYFQQMLCSPDGKFIACLLADKILFLDAENGNDSVQACHKKDSLWKYDSVF